jgi:hypothetical protein
MIAETIKLLKSNKWYGCGENIEIAKGKNEIVKNWSQAKEQIKRQKYWQFTKK